MLRADQETFRDRRWPGRAPGLRAQADALSVPAGAWAVGVSGGADSIALLTLLKDRPDLSLVIVHLDHETRQGASAQDAAFVQALARTWGLDVVVARRSDLEPQLTRLPRNRSARFRTLRLELFRRVIEERKLQGVILAHHADDQAETVMQRLLRGSGPSGLKAMSAQTTLKEMLVLRPLLSIRRDALRQLLIDRKIAWCEDESNLCLDQQRNRVRRVLQQQPHLTDALLRLSNACRRWTHWLERNSPKLARSFYVDELNGLALPIAEFAARRWLAAQSKDRPDIPPAAVNRLLEMANDAATPSRQHFPGELLVTRRRGRITVQSAPTTDA